MADNNTNAVALQKLSNLYVLQNLLNQLQANILMIQQGASGVTLTVNGANLFQLAAQYYQDATQWTTIASANGLPPDPFVPAGNPITLVIPSKSNNLSGGIMQ